MRSEPAVWLRNSNQSIRKEPYIIALRKLM